MGFLTFMTGVLGRGYGRDTGAWVELLGSRNGHERQAAVEALQDLRYGEALPALLLRVNDWVPQVRAAAQKAVRVFLDDAFLPNWIRALDSIVALERARRADHQELFDAISSYLRHPARLPAVMAAAGEARTSVKRYVLELQWQQAAGDVPRYQLLQQALSGADVINARRALARVDAIESTERRCALVGAACCSRFSPIRAQGLRQALSSQRATPSLVRAMCLDDSAMVRAIALGALKEQGDVGVVLAQAVEQLGRDRISGRSRATALQFLCIAMPADAGRHCDAASYSSSVTLRRAAFAALLSAADGAGKTELLLRALADPSPKVQRLAVEHVHRGAMVPPEAQVMGIARSHRTTGALSRAFAVLSHSSAWTRLQWLLHTFDEGLSAAENEVCLQAITQWEIDARSNFSAPTATQRRVVAAGWKSVGPLLAAPLRARIAFHLQTYQIEEKTNDD